MASQMIEAGQIPPMIIVTPEGEQGYWIDHAYGGPRYGTYLAHDLVGGTISVVDDLDFVAGRFQEQRQGLGRVDIVVYYQAAQAIRLRGAGGWLDCLHDRLGQFLERQVEE